MISSAIHKIEKGKQFVGAFWIFFLRMAKHLFCEFGREITFLPLQYHPLSSSAGSESWETGVPAGGADATG